MPGDKIVYRDKRLYIPKTNCKAGETQQGELLCNEFNKIDFKLINDDEFKQGSMALARLNENLTTFSHDILINPQAPEP